MSRKILQMINQDSELTSLRMDAEDLINNSEMMDSETFEAKAAAIKQQIDARYTHLFEKYKNESE